MKVVHLAPSFHNSSNGVVNVAVDLACMQARIGMDVAFIGANGSFRDLLTKEGVIVHDLPLSSAARLFSNLFRLRRILEKTDPDIVHAHMIPGALLAFVLRMGSRFKLVTSVHSSGRFGTVLMSVGEVAICVSNHLAHEMLRRGMPYTKIRVVLNGPLESPRLVLESRPININRPAILTICQLADFKGVGDLISAFALISDVSSSPYLYILGEGRDRAKFERQASQSSFGNRIVFCGAVLDPTPYLKNADVFVLASHREGFGLAVAEARNAGCAIIATNIGGIPEVLEGGSAGILIPPHSPTKLADALRLLLEKPSALESWRGKARSNLGWLSCRRSVAETVRIYRELLQVRTDRNAQKTKSEGSSV